MKLIEQRGGFLHQHRPDVIPQGYVTADELSLWVAYYEAQADQQRREGGR
ncbi:MAG TPA: hypothetical protein P5305_03775 [Rubrivivax sp.]|nr:hypothetical protein [Rubrivivax sp.]HRY86980.1 hypothetical protein [Rubrivivax sp.]